MTDADTQASQEAAEWCLLGIVALLVVGGVWGIFA